MNLDCKDMFLNVKMRRFFKLFFCYNFAFYESKFVIISIVYKIIL